MRRVNLLTTAQPARRSIENAFSHSLGSERK
jgi:hypothetical protein